MGLLTVAAYITVAFVLLGLPILDFIFGRDRDSGSHDWSDFSLVYELIIFASFPLQILVLVWAVSVFREFSLAGKIGWILSTGATSSVIAVNIAHELMHRRDRLSRFMAGFLYTSVCYPGVKIRHAREHHPLVATPDDPGTSRFNQSIYHFIFKVYSGSIPSAWRLSAYRKKAAGDRLWWLRNEMVGWLFLCVIFLLAFYFYAGLQGLVFFVTQGVTAAFILESVNYTTHYGLVRRKLENGRLEEPSRMHAWDYNSWITNVFLINAQRHGDHHENPAIAYQSLEYPEDNPHLPFCYLTMALVGFIPPLWKKLMHPRLYAFYAGQGLDYEKLLADLD